MTGAASSVSGRLGEFASSLKLANLPAGAADKAKACLLNGLAVTMAFKDSKHVNIAARIAGAGAAAPGQGATVLLTRQQVAAPEAVFANGVLCHGENQDDSYHVAAHFGASILPAVLALAELEGQPGSEIIPAIVAGYEVSAAFCRDHLTLTIDRGWRGGPMYSMFGAAAATARLMGLDAAAMAHAIELAVGLSFANVGTVMAHSGETPYQMGIAARNGFTAAWLAREGVTSAPEAIDGQVGFLNLFAGTLELRDRIAGSLGRPFEIMNVTFKRYATSLRAHGPIYLALKLSHEEDLDPAAIEHVALELSPFEFGYPGPGRRTGIDTNVVYGVAGALVYKDGRLPHISKHDNPLVTRLVERVSVDQAEDLPTLCVRLRVRTAEREYQRELTDGSAIHLFDLAGAEELLANRHPELNLAPLIGAIRGLDNAPNIRDVIDRATEA